MPLACVGWAPSLGMGLKLDQLFLATPSVSALFLCPCTSCRQEKLQVEGFVSRFYGWVDVLRGEENLVMSSRLAGFQVVILYTLEIAEFDRVLDPVKSFIQCEEGIKSLCDVIDLRNKGIFHGSFMWSYQILRINQLGP